MYWMSATMGWARDNVAESGGSLTVSHDIASAYAGADVVYAKELGRAAVLRQLGTGRADPRQPADASSWTKPRWH